MGDYWYVGYVFDWLIVVDFVCGDNEVNMLWYGNWGVVFRLCLVLLVLCVED